MDEVYERSLVVFKDRPSSALVPNVICRVAAAEHPVSLPGMYPQLPDVNTADRQAWFKRIVDWWQKKAFVRLSGDRHFNHGSRIHGYVRDKSQFERIVEAIKQERGTSRAVVTLLNPNADEPQKKISRFPSFCFVQFQVRDLGEKNALDVIGYFRKQEMRYWWPVNIAELVRLQSEVFSRVKADVEGGGRKELVCGVITTIAATAQVDTKVPYILVPAIDFDLEESPEKLWDMTYAVCWTGMSDRDEHCATWESVLRSLIPPSQQDPDGVLVGIQGVEFLAEIAEHFARHHGGDVENLGHRLRELYDINWNHANTMANRPISHDEHDRWRAKAVAKINEIRDIVNRVFDPQIAEFQ